MADTNTNNSTNANTDTDIKANANTDTNTTNKDTRGTNYSLRVSIIFSTITGTVFMILKLVGVTSWSWWAITAPFWGIISQCVLVLIIHRLLQGRDSAMIAGLIGISGIINVFIIFVILRILGVLNWPWPAIGIPLWVGIGLTLLIVVECIIKHRFADTQKKE